MQFAMQFVRKNDSIRVQVSPPKSKSEKDDANKWEVSSVMGDEVAVSDYLSVIKVNGILI